jgi:hypothetical protein
MLSAINFNHQSLLQTDKIDDVGSNGSLSPEFISAKVAKPKMTPKQAFGVCRIASQLSRSPCGCLQFPHPSLPPERGKESKGFKAQN